MNAANESAVNAYLAGRIKFLDIERTVFETVNCMDSVIGNMELTIESVKQTDKDARIYAEELINGKINS
jgi:1-deoxy-D-xylulose-5-phosphate reductoisomerase